MAFFFIHTILLAVSFIAERLCLIYLVYIIGYINIFRLVIALLRGGRRHFRLYQFGTVQRTTHFFTHFSAIVFSCLSSSL